jgi:ribonucleoside-diphosphate reductase alpha chain
VRIERHFTAAGGDPFAGLTFVERKSLISNADGSAASKEVTLLAPAQWSQLAVDMLAQKYLRRAGVPDRRCTVPEEGVPPWLWRHGPEEDCSFVSEADARQVFHRVAGCWAYWGWKGGYFKGADRWSAEESALAFYEEWLYLLSHQIAAPNSPTFFNGGIHWAYGIGGSPEGHYRATEEGVTACRNSYENPQLSACYINSVSDNLVGDNGIMDLWTREARIFKFGSGSGCNLSELRGEGEPLSGGGCSSGVLSWAHIGDTAAGAIKSAGTTRRAAKLLILDVDHPNIRQFVGWKVTEEQKVADLVVGSKVLARHLNKIFYSVQSGPPGEARFSPGTNRNLARALAEAAENFVPPGYAQRCVQLARQGYTGIEVPVYEATWESESYRTVAGQNANNSVRVTNAFMEAAERGGPHNLYWRTEKRKAAAEGRNPSPCVTFPARELWDEITYAAWSCADPGLHLKDTTNEWHTCPNTGEIRGANPCQEYLSVDDTSCNLLSLNLVKFLPASKGIDDFDLGAYSHCTRLAMLAGEISVFLSSYPSARIAEMTFKTRTVGLSCVNLGGLLMRCALPYDSPRGRATAAALNAVLLGHAYATSAEIADEMGPFPEFPKNRDAMLRVLRNHLAAATPDAPYHGLSVEPTRLDNEACPPRLAEEGVKSLTRAVGLGEDHGYRNAQATLVPPAGTIGLLMDCDCTGLEPDFALVKFKTLAGGGVVRIVNQSVPHALARLGYSPDQILEAVTYLIGRKTLNGCPHREKVLAAFGKAQFTQDQIDKLITQAVDLRAVLPKEHGLSARELEEANQYVCGAMTLEGAPHVRAEHLAVFDCASRCGRKGTRVISPEAHIDMVAAVQPFLSGASSKTVNTSHDATVDDISRLYRRAWKSGCKAIAVYRDQSKLSQPLQADFDPYAGLEGCAHTAPDVPAEAERLVYRYIAARRRLPDRRGGYTQKARIGGHKFYLRTGEYEDGTLGEIFLDMHKEGATFRSLVNSLAIVISLALQHGVPLEEFVDAFVMMRFEPNGVVEGNAQVPMCSSLMDYLFRELAITYLGRTDLGKVRPDDLNPGTIGGPRDYDTGNPDDSRHGLSHPSSPHVKANRPKPMIKAASGQLGPDQLARLKGYEGDPCPVCMAFTLVRNGTCLKCTSCGESTGCS